jgi:DNA-binding beta-propeller fold protein YncE
VARRCSSWLGTGQPGHEDGPPERARFWEPSGLATTFDRVYVADTNNHAVRVIDRTTGLVRTLELQGLAAPSD